MILGLPYDVEVDMWSLGCLLAELHMARPLFPGDVHSPILYGGNDGAAQGIMRWTSCSESLRCLGAHQWLWSVNQPREIFSSMAQATDLALYQIFMVCAQFCLPFTNDT